MTTEASLSTRQLLIAPIGAATARGDMPRLDSALRRGLDAGLSISNVREVLVQLYAYAGFPRSLNAVGQLMKVLEDRQAQGIADAPGQEPAAAIPTGQALLEQGTAVQTRLIGAPVVGPLFEFAPALDRFLKTHLFGDIFLRDNLDWPSRELATVGALAALQGTESQLTSHVRVSLNIGLTATQLGAVAEVLAEAGEAEAAGHLQAALASLGAPPPGR